MVQIIDLDTAQRSFKTRLSIRKKWTLYERTTSLLFSFSVIRIFQTYLSINMPDGGFWHERKIRFSSNISFPKQVELQRPGSSSPTPERHDISSWKGAQSRTIRVMESLSSIKIKPLYSDHISEMHIRHEVNVLEIEFCKEVTCHESIFK